MLTLQALCTSDLDQLQKAFDQQVTFDDTNVNTAAIAGSNVVVLPPSASSIQYNFPTGLTAASFLMIVANQKVQVQLNSNTAPLVDVDPIPAALAADVLSAYQRQDQPGLVVWRGKVTSLFLSNPSSSVPANLFVALVGNAP